MKKVLVVSCYFQKNYGSALQALATQMALDKLGIENDTVRYDGLEDAIKTEKYKYYVKKLLNLNVVLGKMGYVKMRLRKKNPFSSLGKKLKRRDAAIKMFEKNFRLTSMNWRNWQKDMMLFCWAVISCGCLPILMQIIIH
jgi:hypothetical protein